MKSRRKVKDNLKSKRFGEILQAKLREIGSNPRRLAVALNKPYDPLRLIYNGEHFPGPKLLQRLCDYLELDYEKMKQVVEEDKALSKNSILKSTFDPMFLELHNDFVRLHDESKKEIVEEIKKRLGKHSASSSKD